MGEALNQLRRHDAALAASVRDHQRIIGFLNLLIHGDATVDDSVVWDIAVNHLAPLQADLHALLERLGQAAQGDAP